MAPTPSTQIDRAGGEDSVSDGSFGASVHRRSLAEFIRKLGSGLDIRNHVRSVMQASNQVVEPHFVRKVAVAYIACMLVVIALILSGQVVVQIWVSNRTLADTEAVNTVGKQRMYSQQIVKDALVVHLGKDATSQDYVQQLRTSSQVWRLAQLDLQHSSSGSAAAFFSAAAPYFEAMYDSAVGILQNTTGQSAASLGLAPPFAPVLVDGSVSGFMAAILEAEGAYLENMDQVVSIYESAGRWHQNVLSAITWAITLTVILTLVLEGLLVIRPVLMRMQTLVSERFDLLRASLEAEASARSVALLLLAYITHELEHPLQSVLHNLKAVYGHVRRLPGQRDKPGDLKSTCESMQQIILDSQASLRMMATIVEDVSDVRRLERGTLALALGPVDIGRSVRHVVGLVQCPAGVDVLCKISADVEGRRFLCDRHRLEQLLLNLTVNAVRFSKAGTVTVTAALLDGGKRLRFEVQDSGDGVSEELATRLFMPFSDTPRAAGGQVTNGVGLYVCRLIADVMGGSIGLVSKPGEGSTFWFVLPARQPGLSLESLMPKDEDDCPAEPFVRASPTPLLRLPAQHVQQSETGLAVQVQEGSFDGRGGDSEEGRARRDSPVEGDGGSQPAEPSPSARVPSNRRTEPLGVVGGRVARGGRLFFDFLQTRGEVPGGAIPILGGENGPQSGEGSVDGAILARRDGNGPGELDSAHDVSLEATARPKDIFVSPGPHNV